MSANTVHALKPSGPHTLYIFHHLNSARSSQGHENLRLYQETAELPAMWQHFGEIPFLDKYGYVGPITPPPQFGGGGGSL